MRETIRSVGVAGFAVLAVALAAATLDSTAATGRRDPSAPAGTGGGAAGGPLPLPNSGSIPGREVASPIPPELFLVPAALAALVLAAYFLRRRRLVLGALLGLAGLLALTAVVSPAVQPVSVVLLLLGTLATIAYAAVHRRTLLEGVLASVAAFFLIVVLAQFLSSALPRSPRSVIDPGPGTVFGGSGGGAVASQATPPVLLVLSVLALGLVGAAVALRRSPDDDEADSGAEVDDGDRARGLGRAAGRAADRLERRPGVDNEVYRAWREMTALLDASDRATTTPGEFAEAAVAAGLGREDVTELTRLFEEVRYGETPPTDEHERRAVAVFRRIENRYAEADA